MKIFQIVLTILIDVVLCNILESDNSLMLLAFTRYANNFLGNIFFVSIKNFEIYIHWLNLIVKNFYIVLAIID